MMYLDIEGLLRLACFYCSELRSISQSNYIYENYYHKTSHLPKLHNSQADVYLHLFDKRNSDKGVKDIFKQNNYLKYK